MAPRWEDVDGEVVEDAMEPRTGRAPRREAQVARRRTSAAPRPRRFVARLFGVLAAIGLFISVALVAPVTTMSELAAPGGVLIAVGRVTAMAGTYLMLVTLLLIARIPAIERSLGQDTLVRLHRRLGPWVLALVGAHVVAVTLGYAQQVKTGALHELGTLITTFPGMLLAAAGFGLLVMAGVTSYRYARRKMRYETWWAVHLYTYLAVGLSFAHQLWTGAPFLGHPAARAWWIGVWALTAGTVVAYRWLVPLEVSLRHRLRVHAIEEEAPGVVSVVMRGRRLDRLPVAGGQFMHWRFLRRGMWWQAHPYSVSALPTRDEIRITVKDLGDHSESLKRLTPGTRVAIEGPYGAFTHHARHTDRVLLVAAGVGATPVRAMLDDLPRHVDVVTILRGARRLDLVLRDEITQLVSARGGRLHEVVGPRAPAQ
ncbi:MAG: ferric reductase-like transmembrane domain-containing protein, partial [Actinobacteria bacterium]|nr:ferric reductase-like transmembrane domain-containing protein [Actinomycetota bacterium]